MKVPGGHLLTELREYWRQLGLPECPHCGHDRILPSRPQPWEKPLTWIRLSPYRCGRCQRRFYLRGRPSEQRG